MSAVRDLTPGEDDWRLRRRSATRAAHRATYCAALDLIREDLAAGWDVDTLAMLHQLGTLAGRLYVSPRSLQRSFADQGTSVRREITRLRMEAACRHLIASRGYPPPTVRTVARKVGYRQPAQFAKAFRRVHGILPSELRWAQWVA